MLVKFKELTDAYWSFMLIITNLRTMLLQNLKSFERVEESQLNLSDLILVSRIKLLFTANKTFVFRNN